MRIAAPAALFGLAVLASAAQPPKDVTGWGKITWGMTVAEARSALGNEAKETSPNPRDRYPTKLYLRDVQIGEGKGFASIQTKQNSDLVCVVRLLASFPGVEKVPGERAVLFETLKGMLIEKYGQPNTSDRKSVEGLSRAHEIETTVFWSFPSTSITLEWSDDSESHVGYVVVEYKSVDKKALDTL